MTFMDKDYKDMDEAERKELGAWLVNQFLNDGEEPTETAPALDAAAVEKLDRDGA